MLKLILIVLALVGVTVPAAAQEWCGPYPCGYDGPVGPLVVRRGYGWRPPPPPQPGMRGPQFDPCIRYGECGEPPPQYRVPRFRYPGERYDDGDW